MLNSGVYEIANIITGKRYVGSAVNLSKRINQHRRHLIDGDHDNQYLQRAWNKYGYKSFIFRQITLCRKDELLTLEQKEIDATPKAMRYNLAPIAGSMLGFRFSEESVRKLEKVQARIWSDPKRRQLQSDALKAAWRHPDKRRTMLRAVRKTASNPEVIAKISDSLRGRKRPDHAEAMRRLWSSATNGRALREANNRIEKRQAHGAAIRAWWRNPENRKGCIAAQRAGWERVRAARTA